jgi:hypothetical protein
MTKEQNMSATPRQHRLLPEGESTENWAIREPGFLGSIRQLLDCARCGQSENKRHDEPRHYRDLLKPTMHLLCDECWEALPE